MTPSSRLSRDSNHFSHRRVEMTSKSLPPRTPAITLPSALAALRESSESSEEQNSINQSNSPPEESSATLSVSAKAHSVEPSAASERAARRATHFPTSG